MVKDKPHLVLLGANGMLGHALQSACDFAKITTLSHSQLDITNQRTVLEMMTQLKPNIIVNAAAYTKVDDCEQNTEIANRVNGEAVGYLASAAKHVSATFVHFSTDYVFSGDQASGYKETDQPATPVNAYGRSKLLGERAILSLLDHTWSQYYLIRTSWLFGAYGQNFVDTMLSLGRTKPSLQVVNDQHGSPTYSVDLAAATASLLNDQYPFGIYHLTNSNTCSWFEFAEYIFKTAHVDTSVKACSSQEFIRPAKRPTYSILLNSKFPPLRGWQQAVEDYLSSAVDASSMLHV